MAVSYQNWRGQHVEVPDETLAAVLAALGANRAPRARPGPVGAAVAPFPARRGWGFAVQLYSVRSRASWGHGDLHDLADLAAWSGGDLGADFVLVNPLHAAEPQPPVSPSPYLPMSRRQISPLYLRIEDIPEYRGAERRGPGPGRGAGRAAAGGQRHRGAYRPGRGLGRQARRGGADPRGAADREPPGRTGRVPGP